jgi:hypothetical protein
VIATIVFGIVATLAILFGIWRDWDARKARREQEKLRKRLELTPLVAISGHAVWRQAGKSLEIHGEYKNHGPGTVRDVDWGCTISGADHFMSYRHTTVSEGETVSGESLLVEETDQLGSVALDNPASAVEWWVRYSNALGERLEVRFREPETLEGPFELVKVGEQPSDQGQTPIYGHGHSHLPPDRSIYERRQR